MGASIWCRLPSVWDRSLVDASGASLLVDGPGIADCLSLLLLESAFKCSDDDVTVEQGDIVLGGDGIRDGFGMTTSR